MQLKLKGSQWLMVGSNIVITFIISIIIGIKVDQHLGTKPRWILIMLALAIGSVFILFWRLLKAVERDLKH